MDLCFPPRLINTRQTERPLIIHGYCEEKECAVIGQEKGTTHSEWGSLGKASWKKQSWPQRISKLVTEGYRGSLSRRQGSE